MAFGAGTISGNHKGLVLPGLAARISVPDVYLDTARGRVMHRQVSQLAAADTLNWHNRIIMREHFKQTNRKKYKHSPRADSTKARKKRRFNSITDLKKTGRSKGNFLGSAPRVSFKSGTSEGIVFAYQRYRWPFPKSAQKTSPKAVTQQMMNEEVTRWTDEEATRAARVYSKSWAKHYNQKISGRKKLKKLIGPQL